MKKRFLTLIAVAILCFGVIIPSIGSVNALATDDTAAATTTAQKLDPANLADGKYTINAPLMKEGKDTASLAQTYFDKKADLLVENGKYRLTLHLIKNASMISDVATVNDNKPATVTSNNDQTADLTFDIANLTDATTLSLVISILPTMKMSQKMDVKPDVATLTLVQAAETAGAEQAATTSTSESESGNSSSSSASSAIATENGPTTTQPATSESTAEETTTTSSSNQDSNTDTKTAILPTDPITSANPTTTPDNGTDESNPNTTLTQTPLFDSTNLSDGTYQVPVSVLKTGTTTPSTAASYFSDSATVVVSDNTTKVTVTLHVIKNASLITAFSIGNNDAIISNKTSTSEDLTFTVDNQFSNPTVTANMAITIPALNKTITEAADLQFASALHNTPTDSTTSSDTTETNNENDDQTAIADLPTFDPNNLQDGQYKIDASILKSDSDAASLSASFFDPYATVTVTDNTKTVRVTLHVIKNAATIEQFALDSQAAEISNKTSASEDLTFTVNDSFKAAVLPATMTIKVPVLNTEMNQQARVKFGTALFVNTPANNESGADLIDNPTGNDSDTDITDQPGTTDDNDQASADSDPADLPIFDPTNLKDGQYKIDVSILKTDSDTASLAASYFNSYATVTVSNNTKTVKVTLHVIKNASTIEKFMLGSQAAEISNKTSASEDLTFVVDDSFKDAIMGASMTIKVPMLNTEMNQQARVKFGTALFSNDSTNNNSDTDTANEPGTTSDNNNETNTDTDNSNTILPTFDPTNLKDGQYKIDASILKANSDDPSVSAEFFDPYATVTVSNDTKTVTVTLHVTKNAATIENFSLAGQAAQVTNRTADSEDLAFTVDDTFKDAIMNASMTIKVPVLNTEMAQQARVKFGTALFGSKTTDDDSSSTETPTDNPSTNTSIPKQDTDYNVNDRKDGSYKIQAPIMSASDSSLQTPSAAQNFISKTATIIVSNNGSKVQLLLQLTSGANYIKQMSIDGQQGKIINQKGDTADLIFNISNETLLGIGKVEFNLVTPLGQMSEPAYIIFNLSNKPLDTYKGQVLKNTNVGNDVAIQSQHGIIDPTKDVQYVPYKVLDSSKTSLSTANNYYTKSAKVVKSGSGYDIYLTVKETAGMVQFTPLSINNGGIMDPSYTKANGQDVWSYAFHVTNANGLDNLIPAQIMMSVPIAQITNQHFNIWLSFGKAQTGGADYLNSGNTNALPTSTLALVNSGNNTTAPTLLANTPKNRKKLAANNPSAKNSASTNDKLASIKQYPLIAEIVGFSAIALGIIGFAFYKKYRG